MLSCNVKKGGDYGGTDEGYEHYPRSVQSPFKGKNFGKQHGICLP